MGIVPLGARRRSAGFQVVMRQSALNEIHDHGLETPHVEVCGVLIGGVYRDDLGQYLHVRHVVRGESSESTAGSVTFTSETWDEIHRLMEQQYPDERILGWYHTHPNHGIFLSSMDTFIHENFFDLPWQVAFVHDPVRLKDGMFTWQDGSVKGSSYQIERDDKPVGALNPDFRRECERKLLVWLVAAIIALALGSVAVVWSQVPPLSPELTEFVAQQGGNQ